LHEFETTLPFTIALGLNKQWISGIAFINSADLIAHLKRPWIQSVAPCRRTCIRHPMRLSLHRLLVLCIIVARCHGSGVTWHSLAMWHRSSFPLSWIQRRRLYYTPTKDVNTPGLRRRPWVIN